MDTKIGEPIIKPHEEAVGSDGLPPLAQVDAEVLLAIRNIRYGSVELSTVFSALLLNAILGFVLLWIACHAYNWVASRFGGIEIHLTDAPEEA